MFDVASATFDGSRRDSQMARKQGTRPSGGPPRDSGALDVLLADYAAGSLSRPLHALVASHLAISARNRNFAGALEGLCGHRLREIEPAPIANREKCLAAVFAAQQAAEGAGRASTWSAMLPLALQRYMGPSATEPRWQTLLPGLRYCRLDPDGSATAGLYWIAAGQKFPRHSHEGAEITLVLKGGMCDATGHYQRGDIAIADAEIEHSPSMDADEDCVCFIVTDGALRFGGRKGAALNRLIAGEGGSQMSGA
ncbi:MAG: cupin domain-containing protein [Methylobacteriaceae bacterium]|nr:cupin domain-containing protein [Methylobacteriaceae bacterium]